jgi:hypothetical protein
VSSLSAVADVGFGLAGVISAAVAGALIVGSRRHPDALPWRTRLIPSPRLLSAVFGLLAAAWVALCTARLAFTEDSGAQKTGVVLAWLLFVAAALTHLKWLRRPAPSRNA